MVSLYDRYKRRFRICKEELNTTIEDDASLDCAAFDAHQSLEFLLKHIIEESKGSYRKGHKILEMYEELKGCCDLSFSRENELIALSPIVSDWETESRYGKGILTTVTAIKHCLDVTESLDKEWIEYRSKRDENEQDVAESSTISAAIKAMSGE